MLNARNRDLWKDPVTFRPIADEPLRRFLRIDVNGTNSGRFRFRGDDNRSVPILTETITLLGGAMAGNSESYHEPYELLSDQTRDMHRAVVTVMEELEAIDWYQQRAEACTDEELRSLLLHNKNEEIEHAMMALEWIRRNNSTFDRQSRTYLYSTGSITQVEESSTSGDGGAATVASAGSGGHFGSLGVGSLKGRI